MALIDQCVRRTFDAKIQRLRKHFDDAVAGYGCEAESALDMMAQMTDSLKSLVNSMYPGRYVKLNPQELYHLRRAVCVCGPLEKFSDMLAKIDTAIERMRLSVDHAIEGMFSPLLLCEIDTLLEDMHPGGYVRFTHAEIAFLKRAMSNPAVHCPSENDLTECVTAKLDGK